MYRITINNHLAKKWQRTAFMDEDDQLFLPCGLFGNESMILLSLLTDGVRYVPHQKHGYAPVAWLEKEFPQQIETIRTISENFRSAATDKE